tara:strand:- start:65 stop:184 length:120 start_codon:yes stop_codon:yes gene_type:complete
VDEAKSVEIGMADAARNWALFGGNKEKLNVLHVVVKPST